jgi:hypothetical protein
MHGEYNVKLDNTYSEIASIQTHSLRTRISLGQIQTLVETK